ncbi:MAG: hypothetical protein JO043_01850 [Candidatus Eremiobacteraeota bacterium]|nr:hypothetical protein [Candidatus Eremiobacteraeota bacterium]
MSTWARYSFAVVVGASAAFAAVALVAARPTSQSASRPMPCVAVVHDIVDLGRGKDLHEHAYAVRLDALAQQSTRTSGTLALFAGDDRYDVNFSDVLARGRADSRSAVPIVVRFPAAVHIDRGYIAALGAPRVQSCVTMTREADDPQASGRIPAWFGALLERTRELHVVEAPRPQKEARAQCSLQNRRAYAKSLATPSVLPGALPSELQSKPVDVPVLVMLSDSGSVLDARPAHPSSLPALDDAAVDAARRSAFVPQLVRCRPQGGEYLFVMTYLPDS